jgi:heme-degrading monooxygenase HmoA
MYVVVWEFRVRRGAEEAFIAGYGSGGDWNKLFSRTGGYVGTELVRSVNDPRVFYTLDTWQSDAGFAEFRRRFSAEYEALDKNFEGLTEQERLVGAMVTP